MKILAFSDWRIQPFKMLVDIVRSVKPDAILYAGDDLDRFIPSTEQLLLKTSNHLIQLGYPDFKPTSSQQSKLFTPKAKRLLPMVQLPLPHVAEDLRGAFYFVNGNDDFVMQVNNRWYTRINEGRVNARNKRYFLREDERGKITLEEWSPYLFLEGDAPLDFEPPSDAGIYAPINPSFGEFQISSGDETVTVNGIKCQYGLHCEIVGTPRKYSDIFLSHVPPQGILDLSVRFGIDHIGSQKLMNAVKQHKPRLVICGHSHIWGGQRSQIGDTVVINVSSQDRDPSSANYALIDTSNWSVKMERVQHKSIYAIPGMRAIIRYFGENYDFDSMQDLQDCDQKTVLATLRKIGKRGVNVSRVRERIKSVRWQKPRLDRPISFDPCDQAFVDVETGLAQGDTPGALWLIGIWYKGEIRQFEYPKEKVKFLRYIKKHRIDCLASWTRYDAKALQPVFEQAGIPMYFIDACQRTRNCLVWHTYRLHELYEALFGENLAKGLIEGYTAGLYGDHLIVAGKSCPFCPSPQQVIDEIKERNKIDIILMERICRKLYVG